MAPYDSQNFICCRINAPEAREWGTTPGVSSTHDYAIATISYALPRRSVRSNATQIEQIYALQPLRIASIL